MGISKQRNSIPISLAVALCTGSVYQTPQLRDELGQLVGRGHYGIGIYSTFIVIIFFSLFFLPLQKRVITRRRIIIIKGVCTDWDFKAVNSFRRGNSAKVCLGKQESLRKFSYHKVVQVDDL